MARYRTDQKARELMGRADLQRRINELENQLSRMHAEKTDLAERLREFEEARDRPRKEAAALARALDDEEGVELFRRSAWASHTGIFEHWDAAAGDYAYPEGWPDGTTREAYIAKELGLGTAAPEREPPQADTTLHRMLAGREP